MPNLISVTSKMPGGSTSFPIRSCKTGAKLAQIPGSACFDCYAGKGFYRMPYTERALRYRLNLWEEKPADWAQGLIEGINRKRKPMPHFRWFDSGDLQSLDMLKTIKSICKRTPDTKHWLPTKEYILARQAGKLPDNLVLRVSAPMVDTGPPTGFQNTSTIHKDKNIWGWRCPALRQGGSCGSCRKCWDRTVLNVSYPLH